MIVDFFFLKAYKNNNNSVTIIISFKILYINWYIFKNRNYGI